MTTRNRFRVTRMFGSIPSTEPPDPVYAPDRLTAIRLARNAWYFALRDHPGGNAGGLTAVHIYDTMARRGVEQTWAVDSHGRVTCIGWRSYDAGPKALTRPQREELRHLCCFAVNRALAARDLGLPVGAPCHAGYDVRADPNGDYVQCRTPQSALALERRGLVEVAPIIMTGRWPYMMTGPYAARLTEAGRARAVDLGGYCPLGACPLAPKDDERPT